MTTTFEYDDAGQLTECDTEEIGGTTFEYDLNGNVIERDDGSVVTEFEYSDKNGLIGVAVNESTVWQSTYYPDGKRYCKTNTDGSIYYLYDGGKAIGTYDTDWSRRESFGYGLGSRDPIVNTQYYEGQDAYYYVKDGLGNVNMILNADEATEATIGVTGCEVPVSTGSYESDINFGAGSWWYDDDLDAYVGNEINPESGKTEGWKRYWHAKCGHCVTEIGLAPWEFDDDPVPPPPPWPPFQSPLPGNPVTLDAGDAGFGLAGQEVGGGSGLVNPDARHCNGIDWAARAYVDFPLAVTDYKKTIRDGDEDKSFRDYDSNLPFMSVDYEMKTRRSLGSRTPSDPPDWRVNGPGTGIRYAGYRHQIPLPGRYDRRQPASSQGDEVSMTNRYANDSNTGPHLHLYLRDDNGAFDPTGSYHYTGPGADAAWQEKYFPPLPEVPLHIYLTAICRYGWIQSGFGSYSNDWNLKWGAPASLHCMWTGNGPGGTYTYGDCASRCQGAVAHRLMELQPDMTKRDACDEAHGHEMFYPTSNPQTEGEHVGCAACCDTRFSVFLMGYAGSGLPMDNLKNATDEGYIKMKWMGGLPNLRNNYYNIPWYIYTEVGSVDDLDRDALYYMGEQMLTAWNLATQWIEGPAGGTCADLGWSDEEGWVLPPDHDQGPGWCEIPDFRIPDPGDGPIVW